MNIQAIKQNQSDLDIILSKWEKADNEVINLAAALGNKNRIVPEEEIKNDIKIAMNKSNEFRKEYKAKLLEIYTLINI